MCPGCGEPLIIFELEGIEIDHCVSCLGTWLDSGELEQILERRVLEFSDEEQRQILDVRKAPAKGPLDPAPCPKCGEVMKRAVYNMSVCLVIDVCSQHGVWLDTGEIKTVQAVAEKSANIHRMLLKKLGIA